MIFSPEGVVSSQDYEYQIKAICKMVSNRNHAFGAAGIESLHAFSRLQIICLSQLDISCVFLPGMT